MLIHQIPDNCQHISQINYVSPMNTSQQISLQQVRIDFIQNTNQRNKALGRKLSVGQQQRLYQFFCYHIKQKDQKPIQIKLEKLFCKKEIQRKQQVSILSKVLHHERTYSTESFYKRNQIRIYLLDTQKYVDMEINQHIGQMKVDKFIQYFLKTYREIIKKQNVLIKYPLTHQYYQLRYVDDLKPDMDTPPISVKSKIKQNLEVNELFLVEHPLISDNIKGKQQHYPLFGIIRRFSRKQNNILVKIICQQLKLHTIVKLTHDQKIKFILKQFQKKFPIINIKQYFLTQIATDQKQNQSQKKDILPINEDNFLNQQSQVTTLTTNILYLVKKKYYDQPIIQNKTQYQAIQNIKSTVEKFDFQRLYQNKHPMKIQVILTPKYIQQLYPRSIIMKIISTFIQLQQQSKKRLLVDITKAQKNFNQIQIQFLKQKGQRKSVTYISQTIEQIRKFKQKLSFFCRSYKKQI